MKAWKRAEHRAAKLISGTRIVRSHRGEWKWDIESKKFVGEVKYRKELPKWLTEVVDSACKKAKSENKYPIVFLFEQYKRDPLIVLKSQFLLDLLKLIK